MSSGGAYLINSTLRLWEVFIALQRSQKRKETEMVLIQCRHKNSPLNLGTGVLLSPVILTTCFLMTFWYR